MSLGFLKCKREWRTLKIESDSIDFLDWVAYDLDALAITHPKLFPLVHVLPNSQIIQESLANLFKVLPVWVGGWLDGREEVGVPGQSVFGNRFQT